MGEESADVIEEASPLAVDLSGEQRDLLKVLWDHLVAAYRDPNGPVWPVWHYIDTLYSRGRPRGASAFDVLESLPRIRQPEHRAADYFLVWWDEPSQPWPLPSSRIGLSVAGLHQVGRDESNSASVADALVQTVSAIAEAQANVEPNPHLVPTVQVPLAKFLGNRFSPTPNKPFAIPGTLIGPLLQREYVPLNLMKSDDWQVNVMGPDLRQFRGLQDPATYVQEITRDSASRTRPVKRLQHLPLVQTIDYLTYVLNDDPGWRTVTSRKFAEAPNLASASALASRSETEDQFQSNLGALWNIVCNFSVPASDSAEMIQAYGKDGARSSLNRLEWWLRHHLDDAGFGRAKAAIADIRSIGKIRNGIAHASAEKHKEAVRAQKKLGIPAMITEWDEAWEIIKSALAAALDVVREEVQNRDRITS